MSVNNVDNSASIHKGAHHFRVSILTGDEHGCRIKWISHCVDVGASSYESLHYSQIPLPTGEEQGCRTTTSCSIGVCSTSQAQLHLSQVPPLTRLH